MPSTFALIAVQRQTAASKSVKPVRREQHLLETGVPITMPTIPPSRSTHAPSFNVSLGHIGLVGGGATGAGGGDFGLGAGGGDFGLGVGGGFGLGDGGGLGGGDWPHGMHASENVEKKRREMIKMAVVVVEAAAAMVVGLGFCF